VRTKQDPNMKMNAPPTMKPYCENKLIAVITNNHPTKFVVIANN